MMPLTSAKGMPMIMFLSCVAAAMLRPASAFTLADVHNALSSATLQKTVFNPSESSVTIPVSGGRPIAWGYTHHLPSSSPIFGSSTGISLCERTNTACPVGNYSCTVPRCFNGVHNDVYMNLVVGNQTIPTAMSTHLSVASQEAQTLSCPPNTSILFGFSYVYATNMGTCSHAQSKMCPIGATSCSTAACQGLGIPITFIYLLCADSASVSAIASSLGYFGGKSVDGTPITAVCTDPTKPIRLMGVGIALGIPPLGNDLSGDERRRFYVANKACLYSATNDGGCNVGPHQSEGQEQAMAFALCSAAPQPPTTTNDFTSPATTPSPSIQNGAAPSAGSLTPPPTFESDESESSMLLVFAISGVVAGGVGVAGVAMAKRRLGSKENHCKACQTTLQAGNCMSPVVLSIDEGKPYPADLGAATGANLWASTRNPNSGSGNSGAFVDMSRELPSSSSYSRSWISSGLTSGQLSQRDVLSLQSGVTI